MFDLWSRDLNGPNWTMIDDRLVHQLLITKKLFSQKIGSKSLVQRKRFKNWSKIGPKNGPILVIKNDRKIIDHLMLFMAGLSNDRPRLFETKLDGRDLPMVVKNFISDRTTKTSLSLIC